MPKKKIAVLLFCLAVILNVVIVFCTKNSANFTYNLEFNMVSDKPLTLQVFYGNDNNFTEVNSIKKDIIPNQNQNLKFDIPSGATGFFRIDFGDQSSNIMIEKPVIQYKSLKYNIAKDKWIHSQLNNGIKEVRNTGDIYSIKTSDVDPYIVINLQDMNLYSSMERYNQSVLLGKKVIMCLFIDILLLILFLNAHRFFVIPLDLYRNRKLIMNLSRNDFKTKYAGSYFGIFWAFVQPVITILLYWFVFQVGFRSSSMDKVPFVLWLIAGLVPWFFYSDGLSSATNCFLEYSYLVKKVVFTISILPMVKIGAAFFVHAFFICFTIVMYSIYGYLPSVYTIQILYYTICMFMLILSMSYITSSIVLFFRDLGQIIMIFLQIAMWVTPIMWNETMVPEKFLWIFKMNPIYYIIQGYRDSLINKIWFFDRMEYTIYFWFVTGVLFILGITIFKRLRPHFADVI